MKVFFNKTGFSGFEDLIVLFYLLTFILLGTAGCDLISGKRLKEAKSSIEISFEVISETPEQKDTPVNSSEWRIVVLVRGEGEEKQTVTPRITAEGARIVNINPKRAQASARQPAMFFVQLIKNDIEDRETKMIVTIEEAPRIKASCRLPQAIIDLSKLNWEMWHQGEYASLAEAEEIPSAPDKTESVRLPRSQSVQATTPLTMAMGVTWLRTRFVIPDSYYGRHLCFSLDTSVDAGIVFLNGRMIARNDSGGPKICDVPDELLRWGAENELCIGLENSSTGAGIFKAVLVIGGGKTWSGHSFFTNRTPQREQEREKAEQVGNRLPLRPMVVRDGVLRYEDGGEAALWGTNYYPQSWNHYASLKKRGIDPRQAIDDDFEDFVQMDFDIIRIHVFDTEISDGEGNLIKNENLDVLDYLISRCNEEGIYLWLTTMAWWGSPNEQSESFSRNTPIQALSMWPETWPIQSNYIEQLLNHQNRYTERRIVDEPCLVLLGIINEPLYWRYEDLMEPDSEEIGKIYSKYKQTREGIRKDFKAFASDESWQSPELYACFRYDTLRRYIDTMVEAIRSTGANQPIAYFSNYWFPEPDIVQAISDSRCDAVTYGAYPGGLPGEPVNDSKNHLGRTQNMAMDIRYSDKARLVYEWDAAGTINKVSTYPAFARLFRNAGIQVACQFQYDSRCLAGQNQEWITHYLNLWHTPEKIVSFMIGGEVFRRLPRGICLPTPPDDQVFSPGAVSFGRNSALLCSEDTYMQARPTDWRPLELPESPGRILGVGTTPYYDYDGTGVVDLRLYELRALLSIYPDVERLRYAMSGSDDAPLTRLHEREHAFRLRLSDWADARVERLENSDWVKMSGNAGNFTAKSGVYRLSR